MKQRFSAIVWREGDWHIAQCIEIDVASQGHSEHEAVDNLREAIELALEKPTTLIPMPKVVPVEVEANAA